ncbi:MAG TPA: SpoIIE family protein phosphatase [Bryobacteraceae bacterium]|jgi:sigma-B regulation protein RsbU (phosphoserine phosphatase)|nr:SpoIIE family protein phosphatase [Bryobacteraceae bacterium]
MAIAIDNFLRDQLLERRHKLGHAIQHSGGSENLHLLLEEVDHALERIAEGSYGICDVCKETIECDRLIADPLVRFCLDHLTQSEKTDLERDLQLAARVQRGLLPKQNLDRYGWRISYYYEPAGLVSGDYCDVIDAAGAGLYFMVGDVSGKGVAASMLMAHLHAMFRTLISVGFSLKCMLEHASRVFSESTLPNQYATLVCGHALPDGKVEFSNAGHPFPLLAQAGNVIALETSDVPVGMFTSGDFSITELYLNPGDRMLIYSDGVSETTDGSGKEYGADHLRELIGRSKADPAALLAACRDDLTTFRRNCHQTDDVTLFVLGRDGLL